jgi:hypothetical protein
LSTKKKLLTLFGKLELRYTRTLCHTRLGDFVTLSRYRIAAKDSSSVVVLSSSKDAGEQITHIHFEGSRYWIYLGKSVLREFFKRMKRK